MTARTTLAEIVSCLSDFDPRAVPVARAREAIERFVVPVDCVERVAIRASLDRVLARDVISPIDVPAHDNSAMDGWALRSQDLSADADTPLVPIGTAYAGVAFEGRVGAGETVRVMTGAVMPEGCDTVAIQEVVRRDGDRILVPTGQQAGQNRRLRGEDLAAGRAALRAGRLIRPADLGLLASLGIAEVPVQRRVRVAFFSTGDELRSIGEPLDPGCVYDSNRYTLHGMLTRLGVELVDLGVVPDSREALEAAMLAASRNADAIVSSGGVSVGEADFTREVMDRLGEVAFWTIAMRPGRPMAFGRVGEAWYFGLPGNPVAVMVTFLFFVRDALIRLSGSSPRPVLPLRARSIGRLRKRPGRTEYQRAFVEPGPDGVLQARITGSQGSGVLRSMSEANALVVLHHDQGDVADGDMVDAIPFDGLI
ncbi:MAG: molybdopterin molybdenumtransferase MoeA [Burkholderiales bacterium]|nr:MAG: molybdopterin molybdenumtransferase MoeA [Burkholderiales bacterium]